MKPLYLTSSWDDGDPLDSRLGELLAKHDIPATFYVPCRNQEGRDVLSDAALKDLASQFEIGSHTLDHVPLDGNDYAEIKRQVVEGKSGLEDKLGEEVSAFCYPGGRNTLRTREIVKNAGFRFARTTADFHMELLDDPYLMPATVQFKPRSLTSFAFNFFKWGDWWRRFPIMLAGVTRSGLDAQMDSMMDATCNRGGIFHFWGHSFDIESFNGWEALDHLLGALAERVPVQNRHTNSGIFELFAGNK